MCQDPQAKGRGLIGGLSLGTAIRHDARKLRYFGYPAAVFFTVEFKCEFHEGILLEFFL